MPSINSMNKDELLAEADRQDVKVPEGATNDEIRALLRNDNDSAPSAAAMVDGRPFGHKTGPGEGDGGAAQIQALHDEANAKGYFGYSPDPTPRANYGALNNAAPTPETDPELRRKMRDNAGINQ